MLSSGWSAVFYIADLILPGVALRRLASIIGATTFGEPHAELRMVGGLLHRRSDPPGSGSLPSAEHQPVGLETSPHPSSGVLANSTSPRTFID
jgi:hypothetical protein